MAEPDRKICRGECGRNLPLDAFSVDHSKRDGKRWVCRTCDSARSQARYQERRAAAGATVRRRVAGAQIAVPRRTSINDPLAPTRTVAEIFGRTT